MGTPHRRGKSGGNVWLVVAGIAFLLAGILSLAGAAMGGNRGGSLFRGISLGAFGAILLGRVVRRQRIARRLLAARRSDDRSGEER